jgi:hypothetical protein
LLPPGHVQRTSLSTSVRTVAAFARNDETTYAVWCAAIANRTVPSATTLWSIPDFGGGGPVTRRGLNVTDRAAEADEETAADLGTATDLEMAAGLEPAADEETAAGLESAADLKTPADLETVKAVAQASTAQIAASTIRFT